MESETETLEERKTRRLAEQYPIKLPPKEVALEFEREDGVVDKYVLRRPSIGDRNRLLKEMGALKVGEVTEVDPSNWVRVIKATLIEPKLVDKEISELDAFVADALFAEGQKILFGSVLTREQKNP